MNRTILDNLCSNLLTFGSLIKWWVIITAHDIIHSSQWKRMVKWTQLFDERYPLIQKKLFQYILCTVDILYTAEIVRVEVWQFAILNRAIFCVYGLRHYCYLISIHCCHCHNDSFLNRARNLERFTKRPLHWFPKCNFARNDSSFVLKCLNHWKRAISLVIL